MGVSRALSSIVEASLPLSVDIDTLGAASPEDSSPAVFGANGALYEEVDVREDMAEGGRWDPNVLTLKREAGVFHETVLSRLRDPAEVLARSMLCLLVRSNTFFSTVGK